MNVHKENSFHNVITKTIFFQSRKQINGYFSEWSLISLSLSSCILNLLSDMQLIKCSSVSQAFYIAMPLYAIPIP